MVAVHLVSRSVEEPWPVEITNVQLHVTLVRPWREEREREEEKERRES